MPRKKQGLRAYHHKSRDGCTLCKHRRVKVGGKRWAPQRLLFICCFQPTRTNHVYSATCNSQLAAIVFVEMRFASTQRIRLIQVCFRNGPLRVHSHISLHLRACWKNAIKVWSYIKPDPNSIRLLSRGTYGTTLFVYMRWKLQSETSC
jgi:hypothetical protein